MSVTSRGDNTFYTRPLSGSLTTGACLSLFSLSLSLCPFYRSLLSPKYPLRPVPSPCPRVCPSPGLSGTQTGGCDSRSPALPPPDTPPAVTDSRALSQYYSRLASLGFLLTLIYCRGNVVESLHWVRRCCVVIIMMD